MDKQVIIELDDDGFIVGVYCPDETYVVNVLDRTDTNPNPEIRHYYQCLEQEIQNLKNCF